MTLVKLFFCATWTQPLGLVFCWILAKFHEFGGELIGFKQTTSCFVFYILGLADQKTYKLINYLKNIV